MGMDIRDHLAEITAIVRASRFYECGGCGHWHRFGWVGDCRVDRQRFTSDQLDRLYPGGWLEVDEITGVEL